MAAVTVAAGLPAPNASMDAVPNAANASVVCVSPFPSTAEYFKLIDGTTWALVNLALCSAVGTLVMFVAHSMAIGRYLADNEYRQSLLLGLATVFPLTSLSATVAVFVPSTLHLMSIFIPAFLAQSLISFNSLVTHLASGKKNLVDKLSRVRLTEEEEERVRAEADGGGGDNRSDIKVVLASGPLRCCKRCLPRLAVSYKSVRILEIMIWQSAGLQAFVAFVAFVMFTNGSPDKSLGTSVEMIKLVSSLVATAACFALVNLTRTLIDESYKVGTLLLFIKLAILFINVQGSIIGLFAAFGVIDKGPLLTASMTGIQWSDMAVCVEMLAMSLLATYVFHPDRCSLLTDHRSQGGANGPAERERVPMAAGATASCYGAAAMTADGRGGDGADARA